MVVGVLQINSTESQGEIPGVAYEIGSNIVSISLFDTTEKLIENPAGKPALKITFPLKVTLKIIKQIPLSMLCDENRQIINQFLFSTLNYIN